MFFFCVFFLKTPSLRNHSEWTHFEHDVRAMMKSYLTGMWFISDGRGWEPLFWPHLYPLVTDVSCFYLFLLFWLGFQEGDVIVPEVVHADLALCLRLIGLLEGILTSAVQHRQGALIPSWCWGMQVFCCSLRAGTHPEIQSEKRERRKWEILSCSGSEECLTIIIFDGIIIAQSNPTPGSYIPSLLPLCSVLPPPLWYEWNWQSDFREPSLNFVWRVFIIPRVSFSD